jgi:hypothetical protein
VGESEVENHLAFRLLKLDFFLILCYDSNMKTLEKKSLFWDVKTPDPKTNSRFIIERILNFGDEEDFRWAVKFYTKEKIAQELLKIRTLNKKSLLFWCLYFNVNKEKCLNQQSTREQNAFWKR